MPGAGLVTEQADASVVSFLRDADMVIGNLESPLARQTPAMMNLEKIPLWSNSVNRRVLTAHGFTHLCLNNNHIFDLYERGLSETVHLLNEVGITPFGLNYGPIGQVYTLECGGITLRFLAVNWVQMQFTGHLAKDFRELDVSSLKEGADFLICLLHWGNDHNIYIDPEQQETAHRLVDQGVDLVVGHHPHVPQGYEVYRGRHIFYSLGNFIFTPREEYPYLPLHIRYDDHRENLLFQRVECKIGLSVTIRFEKGEYQALPVVPVYREHTLPRQLPLQLKPFWEKLSAATQKQVRESDYGKNRAEARRILVTYTLPLLLTHYSYWPILFQKLKVGKLVRFLKSI